MQVQLVTQQDLENFKKEVLVEIRRLLALPQQRQLNQPKYLKSKDVEKMLRLSRGKLFSLRQSGEIPAKQIGRTYYYLEEDIQKIMGENLQE